MKKLISLLVVLAMLMTMVPAVFAAETTETTEYQEVTIPEAIELAAEGSDTKYLVRGTVTSVANTTYGNLYIEDAEGNSLYVYGVYSVDGVTRYDAMETQPVEGDEVLLLGVLTTYNGNAQMKNAWLQELNGETFEAPEVEPDPEADTELTIAEAIALGQSKAHNTYTAGKYYVTGEITEIYNTTYGNMYIQDADGNTLTIYGTYDADGTNRFDAMETQPVVGDTITVYGIIGQYNGTPQMKNGWIQAEPEIPEVEIPEGGIELTLGTTKLNAGWIDENWNYNAEVKEYYYAAEQTGTLYITFLSFGYGDYDMGEDLLTRTTWVQLSINGELVTSFENSLEVNAGDLVNITLNSLDGDRYFALVNLNYEGVYVPPVGTETNPVVLTPDECPTTTIEIPAGGEAYYELDYAFEGYTLFVYGEDAYVIYQVYDFEVGGPVDKYAYAVDGVVTFPVNSYEIRIGNLGDTAATFELDAYVPLGSEYNPDELTIGEHVVELLEGSTGYYYEFTGTERGTLTVTVTGDNWQYHLENTRDPANWSDDIVYSYAQAWENTENSATIDVYPGDEITLMVAILSVDTYEHTAGTLTVTVEFTPAPAEEEEDLTLVLGENTLEAGDGYGTPAETKEYTYVAEQTGTLYITFRTFGCNGISWGESALTNEYYAEDFSLLINGEKVTAFKNSVEVTEGDTVVITLASLDSYPYFAYVVLSYDGYYEEPLGSQFNPVELTPEDLPTDSVEIAAGETAYYKCNYDFYDYTLYIYGEDAFIIVNRYNYDTDKTEPFYIYAVDGVVEYKFEDGLNFQIGNAGDAAATFLIDGEIPLGIRSNPDTLIIGEQVAPTPDNWNGYNYTWTAPEAGTLTLTATGANWGMELGNETTYEYEYLYERDGDSNVVSMEVAAGDVINLCVVTVDAEWNYVGGDVTIVAEFTPVGGEEEEFQLGDVNHDGFIDVEDAMMILQYEVGLLDETELDLTLGNVSGDDLVDVEDAMLILQYEVGLIDKFPAEEEGGEEAAELPLGSWLEIAAGTYTFTAEEDTLLAIAMTEAEWSYTINGVTRTHTDEVPVAATVLKVAAGETVTVVFDNVTYGNINTCAGTAEDPVYLPLVPNAAYTAWELNADLPAGEYVYSMDITSSVFELTVNGELTAFTADPMGWEPATVVINNTEDTNAVFAIELNYPAGTMYNPDELVLGYVGSEMLAFDGLSHWYVYTATEDTLLVVDVMGENWYYWGTYMNADGSFDFSRMTATYSADAETLVPVSVYKVAAGETFALCVGTIDGSDFVEFTANAYAGTAENPVYLPLRPNAAYTAWELNADLPAGEYVYSMDISSAVFELTVNGELTEFTADPMGWEPATAVINNTAETGAVFTIEVNYPVGTMYNPDELELGYIESEMLMFDSLSHWYVYTATEDTLLVVELMGESWYYWGTYMNADGSFDFSRMTATYSADADVLVPMSVYKLAAGETFALCIGSIDGSELIEFNAMTYAGTAEDPIPVNFTWNEDYTVASANIDMPAGEYVLASRGIASMALTVDGVATDIVAAASMREMDKIFVTVEEAHVVVMELTYAVGSMFNPETVEAGEYTAEIEAGNWEGYFYNFVAAADGTLTVTVNAEPGWYFVINNLTTGVYGDAQWSDTNENTMTIEVAAGDLIEIVVNVYDPDNGMGVGGTVTMALAFTPAE